MLIIHGGAPTAVLNSSLYGAIMEAKNHAEIGTVYGALGGTAGVLNEKFCALSNLPSQELELLKQTPATVIGTSRTHLEPGDYEDMLKVLIKYNIRYVLFNGGNGSMDTCGKLYRLAKKHGIMVIGIPKTIDNDIALTDHCPGFGSAARFIAQTVAEITEDVRSMPIHVCIIEAMGRNAGWITAAAALANGDDASGPDLIWLPEIAFDEEKFLTDVQRIKDRRGYAVIVVSEGLKKADGSPVVDPIFQIERSIYFGNVGEYLAELVIKKLGIKARSEKPGIAGRASVLHQSFVDREEAILAGAAACKASVEGRTGVMIGFERIGNNPYEIKIIEIPIEDVMLHERKMPKEFIADSGHGVTRAFMDWCRPLLGGNLLEFSRLNRR